MIQINGMIRSKYFFLRNNSFLVRSGDQKILKLWKYIIIIQYNEKICIVKWCNDKVSNDVAYTIQGRVGYIISIHTLGPLEKLYTV